ncbi:MAG TPA: ABC transporter, partial [Chloroflexi bacterium]|nr:ABC transporter [Chloroflexota bacterium]
MKTDLEPRDRAPKESDDAVVSAHEITRRYGEGDAAVDALREVSIDFARGSFTAVMGA